MVGGGAVVVVVGGTVVVVGGGTVVVGNGLWPLSLQNEDLLSLAFDYFDGGVQGRINLVLYVISQLSLHRVRISV